MQGKYAQDDSWRPRPDLVVESIGDLRFLPDSAFTFNRVATAAPDG
jgi:hypothetical protein